MPSPDDEKFRSLILGLINRQPSVKVIALGYRDDRPPFPLVKQPPPDPAAKLRNSIMRFALSTTASQTSTCRAVILHNLPFIESRMVDRFVRNLDSSLKLNIALNAFNAHGIVHNEDVEVVMWL